MAKNRFDKKSDSELMVLAQAGDDKAFSTLDKRYRPPLYRYFSHHKGTSEAEDLVQESLIRLYQKKDLFDPTRNFTGFVWSIANTVLINYQRKVTALKRGGVNEDLIFDETIFMQSTCSNPLENVCNSELNKNIEVAMESLSESQYITLNMSMKGYSIAEIEEYTGIKPATIKTQKHRARIRMARALQVLDIEHPGIDKFFGKQL